MTDTSSRHSLIGRILAERYEIVGFIGQGAMGAVYKAKHVAMGRICAIKTLNATLLADEKSVLRFHQEAQAMSVLNHPHLIAISDYGQMDDGALYFVMEYLEGISFSDELRKNGPLSISRVVPLFCQIADAVAHAHSKSLIHRDLKPSNVMLTGDNQDFVKVVDFGIAKMVSDGDDPGLHLTQTGEVFGSPLYMSPEQCMGMPMDGRSDIYSFGCLMYEILTGRPALKGLNFVQTAYKHMHEMPPPLKEIRPEVPDNLAAIIEGCLQKSPEDRIPAMSVVRDLLRSLENPSEQAPTMSGKTIAKQLANTLVDRQTASASQPVLAAVNEAPTVRVIAVPSPPVKPANFKMLAAITVGVVCVLGAFFLGVNQTAAVKQAPPAQVANNTPPTPFLSPPIGSSVSVESPVFSHINQDAPEEVDVVAVYQAHPQTEVDAVNESAPPEVNVVVKAKKQPITLVLLSYMPVHWNVHPQVGASISKVVASGYFEQKIDTKNNACGDVTSMCQKSHKNAAFNTAGLFYTDSSMVEQNRQRTYETVAAAVRRMLNKEIRRFEGRFYGTKFVI